MPFPSAGDLPEPGTEPRSPALQADSLPTELSAAATAAAAKSLQSCPTPRDPIDGFPLCWEALNRIEGTVNFR